MQDFRLKLIKIDILFMMKLNVQFLFSEQAINLDLDSIDLFVMRNMMMTTCVNVQCVLK